MNTAGGAINVGAIEVTAARAQNLTLSNSTTVANGILTMVGVEVNGTENVVLRNASDSLLTLTNGTSRAMDVAFANATENKIVIDGAGGITIASDIISADAGVTLTGAGSGALTLAGASTYTGPTSVINGRLNISGSVTSDVTIGAGATLAGLGTIDGNLSFESGANFVFDLTGPLIVNTGTVSFEGFSLSNLVGLTSAVDLGSYTLIGGTATFNFDNVSDFGEVNKVDIGGGKFAYLDSGSFVVEVIPEPSTYALLVLAGAGFAGYVIRRRRR
jgi:autotransporter-associated beta strand protein